MILLILACFSYGLAVDTTDSQSENIDFFNEEDLEFRSMEDDLIDESDAEADVEDLSHEDALTLENLEDDSIEEDIELDEADISPVEKLLGQGFSGEDIQTIEPVSEESDDEGKISFTLCRS